MKRPTFPVGKDSPERERLESLQAELAKKMDAGDELKRQILKAISRAGALSDADLSAMFGRLLRKQQVLKQILTALEDGGLIRRERNIADETKWVAARQTKLEAVKGKPVAAKTKSIFRGKRENHEPR